MTAPATCRIPTPGDLAARKAASQQAQPTPQAPKPVQPYERRKLSAAESLAPGKLTKREHFRKLYRVGMTLSRMHPHARLVGHDLMWRASHATGEVSANYRPSIEQLAAATGLTSMQVDVAFAVLRSRGWLYARPIPEGPRAGQTALHLAIPAGALEDIRQLRGKSRTHGRVV